MRPQLQEDDGYIFWHDADSPVSQDPDDGYAGISDREVEAYITTLRARLNSAREVISEAADLLDNAASGDYKPDSFSSQPARTWLAEDGEE